MSTPFLGMIILVPYNFAPRNWAFCSGQTLSIAQNTALFSLLGTTYGGNGQTTFNLPDLRSRVPVGQGQGPGLSPYSLGQVGGNESVTLSQNQMPLHNHVITLSNIAVATHVSANPGNRQSPVGNFPAAEAAGVTAVYADTAPGSNAMNTGAFTLASSNIQNPNAPVTTDVTGGGSPIDLRIPYLALSYCIAMAGIFPSRN
jgi:microcystin-dependent protein